MSDWQPIETAPKDGTRILVSWTFGGWNIARCLTPSGRWMTQYDRPLAVQPTHWMPLPEPPR